MKATTKHLIGRTIIAVQMRPFRDGRGGTAHAPLVTLDDGRKVWFVTEETEIGEYGTLICITDKK